MPLLPALAWWGRCGPPGARTEPAALAAEGYKFVVTAITAAQAQELMRQDAALQKGAELVLQGLRHVGSGGASARMLVIFAPEGN